MDQADAEKKIPMLAIRNYAVAQAWLTDSSIVIPVYFCRCFTNGSKKVVPFTKAYSYENKGDVYIYGMEFQDKVLTVADYQKAFGMGKRKKNQIKSSRRLISHVNKERGWE